MASPVSSASSTSSAELMSEVQVLDSSEPLVTTVSSLCSVQVIDSGEPLVPAVRMQVLDSHEPLEFSNKLDDFEETDGASGIAGPSGLGDPVGVAGPSGITSSGLLAHTSDMVEAVMPLSDTETIRPSGSSGRRIHYNSEEIRYNYIIIINQICFSF